MTASPFALQAPADFRIDPADQALLEWAAQLVAAVYDSQYSDDRAAARERLIDLTNKPPPAWNENENDPSARLQALADRYREADADGYLAGLRT